jgi:hypothetical protein
MYNPMYNNSSNLNGFPEESAFDTYNNFQMATMSQPLTHQIDPRFNQQYNVTEEKILAASYVPALYGVAIALSILALVTSSGQIYTKGQCKSFKSGSENIVVFFEVMAAITIAVSSVLIILCVIGLFKKIGYKDAILYLMKKNNQVLHQNINQNRIPNQMPMNFQMNNNPNFM